MQRLKRRPQIGLVTANITGRNVNLRWKNTLGFGLTEVGVHVHVATLAIRSLLISVLATALIISIRACHAIAISAD